MKLPARQNTGQAVVGAGTNPFKFDDIEVLISAVEDGQKTRLREVIS